MENNIQITIDHDPSLNHETKKWPYLILPLMWILAGWVMIKKGIMAVFGKRLQINTFWVDGYGKLCREVKEGATSWRALDVVYNFEDKKRKGYGNRLDHFWINGILNAQIGLLVKTLESANEKLKQLDEAKDEFISLVSHQLRAPLSAIKGYSSMLLEGSWGQMSDLQKKQLGIISISCDNLIMLVEDLLTLSRIQAGKLQFDLELTNLEEPVQEIVSSLSKVAEGLIADKRHRYPTNLTDQYLFGFEHFL